MTNKIVLKKSSVSGKIPLPSDLDYGELALNYADGKLYYKTSNNTISNVGVGGATQINRKYYTAWEGQTTFSIQYSSSYVDVYINGIHLSNEDYTATDGTSIVLFEPCSGYDQVDLVGYFTLDIAVPSGSGGSGGSSESSAVTINSTVQTTVDAFPIASYRSAKYIVQVTQGTNYQVSEILVIHDGTVTHMTEYGMMNTNGSLCSFATDINSSNVRLLATMGSALSATINILRTPIGV